VAKLKRRDRHAILECTVCKDRNYVTPFKMRGGKKLSLKKYCTRCRKHTAHRSRRVD
jgi:large subunit ribosomal protein L33